MLMLSTDSEDRGLKFALPGSRVDMTGALWKPGTCWITS